MPAWIWLIPELVKIVVQIWLELRKKPTAEADEARSEMKQAFEDCPNGKCDAARARLKERLESLRDRLRV